MALGLSSSGPSRASEVDAWRFGLTPKLALASAAVALLSGLTAALAVYQPFSRVLEERQLQDLAAHGRVVAARLHHGVAVLSGDTRLLAELSEARQLLLISRAEAPEAPAAEALRSRFERSVETLMEHRPEYALVRVIRAGDGGREIVRVERTEAESEVSEALHRQRHRRILREAIGTPPGAVYLSPVELDREADGLLEPQVPVLRAAVALHDDAGHALGIVVIEHDLRSLIQSVLSNPRAGAEAPQDLYLTDDRGGFLFSPENPKVFEFDRGEPIQHQWPALAGVFTGEQVAQSTSQNQAISLQRVYLDPRNPGRFLTVGLAAPLRGVLAGSIAARQRALGVGAGVIAVGLLLSALVSRSFTRPLKEVTDAVRHFGHDGEVGRLPLDSRDEVGVLARSFQQMIEQVERRELDLERALARAEWAERDASSHADDLAVAVERLKRSNRELDHFAHVASHDLKAPLRGIGNLARFVMEDTADSLPVTSREHLEALLRRVAHLENMLSDLLQFSRAGRGPQRIERVSVSGLIESVLDILDVPESFEIQLASDLPELVSPQAPLAQIFRNLIDNAVKHHDRPPGRIQIDWRDSGGFVEFLVSDDGPGIPPDQHDRVFRLFSTLQPADSTDSSGMGLAIIKKLIEGAGGRIWIESEGRGTAFRFTWPRSSGPPPTQSKRDE